MQDTVMKTPKWLYVAFKELYVSELLGPDDNPRILEYFKATSYHAESDEVPWCSAFVCWCLENAGVKSSGRANARSYLSWGHEVKEPVLGTICVFKRGSSELSGHVAFYISENATHVHVLGGNQGNKVCISSYPKESLLSYRMPDA